MSLFTFRQTAAVLLITASSFVSVAAAANGKIEVVWDGFSFPSEPGQSESCDANAHPSCKLLFSDEYQTRFLEKIESIEDDKYKFVNFAQQEIGETLHLTITINLEWVDVGQQAEINELSDVAFVGKYRLCSSLMLYRADSSRYLLENVSAKCAAIPIMKNQLNNLSAVIDQFIKGQDSDKHRSLEKDWLSEASVLVARKRGLYKPIGVTSIELAADVYPGDNFKRERLRLFVAENMSFQLSQVFRKPVIPPSLSANGQKNLRFRDPSRNRNIALWPASHTIALKVLPFQQKLIEEKKDLFAEYFYSIMTVTHENVFKDRFLENAGFFANSKRPVFKMNSGSQEQEMMEVLIKKQLPAENLEKLCKEIALQIAKPDKKWSEEYTYKSDPNAVFKGFVKLQKELID